MLTFVTTGTHIKRFHPLFYNLGLWLPMSGTTVERGHSRSRSPDRSWRHGDRDMYHDHERHNEGRVYRHIPRSRDVDVEPLHAKSLLSRSKDAFVGSREEVRQSEDNEREVRHRSSPLRPWIEDRYRVRSL